MPIYEIDLKRDGIGFVAYGEAESKEAFLKVLQDNYEVDTTIYSDGGALATEINFYFYSDEIPLEMIREIEQYEDDDKGDRPYPPTIRQRR